MALNGALMQEQINTAPAVNTCFSETLLLCMLWIALEMELASSHEN